MAGNCSKRKENGPKRHDHVKKIKKLQNIQPMCTLQDKNKHTQQG